MRICHVIEAFGGGAGQVVCDLARYQAAQGDDVTVIYSPRRAELRFVGDLSEDPRVLLVATSMRREVGWHDLMEGWGLYQKLRSEGPFDIIHSHCSKAGALARLVGVFLPGRHVYTPHGLRTMMPDASRAYGFIEFLLSFLCRKVIVVSQEEKRHARKLLIPKRKLKLLPNGIAFGPVLSRKEARRELGLSESNLILGFVGRLVPEKNPLLAVETFARVAGDYPNAHLCMIGDGSMILDIRKCIAAKRLESRVHMAGSRDAKKLMPAFDAMLCSSLREGMPLAFIEALAAGVPIVSVPVGGTDEAIISGQTGFVAKDNTDIALAAVLSAFLDLRLAARQRMAEAARTRAGLFTLERMAEQTRDLYWDL